MFTCKSDTKVMENGKFLNLKYSEIALIPCELTENDPQDMVYKLISGERVIFTFISTWNNLGKYHDKELDNLSKKLYDLSFGIVYSAWVSRLGKLSNWWAEVKMTKVN